MSRPETSEYAEFYAGYVGLVPEDDIVQVLDAQNDELRSLFSQFAEEKGTFAYAEGKWTVKQLLSHIIDGERVFAYRFLRISRGDATPLPGFDQDVFVNGTDAHARTLKSLIDEFDHQRRSNVLMISATDEEQMSRTGTASDAAVSARALAWMIAGHTQHHLNILKERYIS
ncbi:MAG: DinB family protein [Acidobacteriota bacterium]|nr:MAG: DinB family protein [Acidobacteriota bacterium]